MSIASEISHLQAAKTAIVSAIEGHGVSVPSGTTYSEFAALIAGIQGGGSLDDIVILVADFSDFTDDVVREGELDPAARRVWA